MFREVLTPPCTYWYACDL